MSIQLRFGFALLSGLCTVAQAQQPVVELPKADLTATVTALDRKLFEAYNTCDLHTLGELAAEDLEFYHDKSGLSVGRQSFLDSIRQNICGKVQRELVPGSLEVHRLEHYGALEMGAHTFTQPGHPEEGKGEALFAMLWRFDGKRWTLSRVISYDHGPAHPKP